MFRDKTGLAATPELWASIEQALAESEYFLLLASPAAAASPWVQREVSWWLAKRRSVDQLFIVLTDGDLVCGESDFGWQRTTALPGNLRGQFKQEPLYVDLKWAKESDDLSLRHSQFRAALLDLAAPLHGKAKDELDGEDVRHCREMRRMRSIIIALPSQWQTGSRSPRLAKSLSCSTISNSDPKASVPPLKRCTRKCSGEAVPGKRAACFFSADT
ncbi:MAG: hypothetical protein ACREV2_15650 [Burkholderiales bacterium]